jgi:hypothetical protein
MLRKAANGSEHIPGLLAKLSRCLRQQEELSRIVPLLSVAIIFRSIYSAPDELSRAEMPVDEQFLSADALATIHEACLREKTEAASRYVPKEKSIAGSWTISSW